MQKCGYSFLALLGTGFVYPSVYQETVEKAKSGELGDELKEFFETHPNGAINAETVLLRCKKCGALEEDKALDMYLPKKGKETDNESAAPLPRSIPEGYVLHKRYPHKCDRCCGEMENLGDMNKPIALKCPECGSKPQTEQTIDWN